MGLLLLNFKNRGNIMSETYACNLNCVHFYELYPITAAENIPKHCYECLKSGTHSGFEKKEYKKRDD